MSIGKRFLRDATVYNGALGAVVFGSLYHNAETWLNDYPPDIRKKFGPQSAQASRLARLWAVPFFAIALGWVILSGARLKKANNGRLAFRDAFKYSYLLFLSFWTFDLVILDWLLFTTIQPNFIILPGTEGMAGYKDYTFHLKVSWPAVPLLVVPSALIGWLHSR